MRQTINIARASQLRQQGLTWDKIARILSSEDDRDPPYHSNSVQEAVRRNQKESKS